MTYDKPNETLRFVWRNESFRFRFFGRVRVQNETKRTVALRVMELAGLGDLRARRPSKWAPLAGLMPQGAMRSIASRRAVRSDQYLRCGSGAFPSQGGLSRPPRGASERGLGNSKARKKWLGSALKSLKQLVRVMASSDRQISRQRSAPISAISRMTPRSRSMSSRCFFRRARRSLSPQASCSRSPLIGRRRSTLRRTRIRSPTPRRL